MATSQTIRWGKAPWGPPRTFQPRFNPAWIGSGKLLMEGMLCVGSNRQGARIAHYGPGAAVGEVGAPHDLVQRLVGLLAHCQAGVAHVLQRELHLLRGRAGPIGVEPGQASAARGGAQQAHQLRQLSLHVRWQGNDEGVNAVHQASQRLRCWLRLGRQGALQDGTANTGEQGAARWGELAVLQARLQQLVRIFIAEKPFIGCAGLQVDDSLAALQALGRPQAAEQLLAQFSQRLGSTLGLAPAAATLAWRSAGGWQAPVVLLAPCGAYRPGLGPFHAQTFEATLAHLPAPTQPMFLCGARLSYFSAILPISDGLGLAFAVTRYDGRLVISPTSCRELMPDPQAFAQCLRDSFQEYLALAAQRTPEPSTASASTAPPPSASATRASWRATSCPT